MEASGEEQGRRAGEGEGREVDAGPLSL